MKYCSGQGGVEGQGRGARQRLRFCASWVKLDSVNVAALMPEASKQKSSSVHTLTETSHNPWLSAQGLSSLMFNDFTLKCSSSCTVCADG